MNAKKDLSIFQSSNEFDVFEGEGSGLQDPGSSASASGESWNLQPAFSVDTALARATGETKTLKDNLSKVKDLSRIFLAWNGVDPASNILDVVPRELFGFEILQRPLGCLSVLTPASVRFRLAETCSCDGEWQVGLDAAQSHEPPHGARRLRQPLLLLT
jgi:hypothetical protein